MSLFSSLYFVFLLFGRSTRFRGLTDPVPAPETTCDAFGFLKAPGAAAPQPEGPAGTDPDLSIPCPLPATGVNDSSDDLKGLREYSLTFGTDDVPPCDSMDTLDEDSDDALEQQPELMGPWSCPECFHDNEADTAVCSLCDADRPDPTEKFWLCPTCAIFNKRENWNCLSCNTQRPHTKDGQVPPPPQLPAALCACPTFCLSGSFGVPLLSLPPSRKRAQVTGSIISFGAKGTRREILLTVANAKKGGACMSTACCWNDTMDGSH